MTEVRAARLRVFGIALVVTLLGLVGAAPMGNAARSAGTPSGGFLVKTPAPGHVVIAVVRVDGGARFGSGAVPSPQLADPAKLPKGVLAVIGVGRVKTQPTVLVARVLLVNLNKAAARKTASAVDFNIATGLKWVPLRYTAPIGIGREDCTGDAQQIACAGSDPKQTPLYGWETHSLDNYVASFPVEQIGIQLSLDIGFARSSAKEQLTDAGSFDTSYFQCGLGVGAKFYLKLPSCQQSSPPVDPPVFKYFAAIDAFTATTSTSPSAGGTLTSPVGRGKLKVTNVRCYTGTGGNAERDADLSLNGQAGWHFQQIYPASFVPGGSQSKPGFFLEHGQPPYTAPGTTIYAGFGVTVSGNVGTVATGQQVTASGGLVDAKGNKVPGSIGLTFACD